MGDSTRADVGRPCRTVTMKRLVMALGVINLTLSVALLVLAPSRARRVR